MPEIARALDGGHTTNGPIVGAISPRPNCAPMIIRNALAKVNRNETTVATFWVTNLDALEGFSRLDGDLCLFYTPGGVTLALAFNRPLIKKELTVPATTVPTHRIWD